MIPASDYAALHNLSRKTVLGWIAKGHLRAKKEDKPIPHWLVAADEPVPDVPMGRRKGSPNKKKSAKKK